MGADRVLGVADQDEYSKSCEISIVLPAPFPFFPL